MKNKIFLICIILLGIINVYWFWPGSLYFLNDDLLHIPLTDKGNFFQTNSVRPLHELLVKLDLIFWGKCAYGYHITALLLHFIVCILLYDLCLLMQLKWLKFDKQQSVKAALLAVVLFLMYPQSSESIAWILGRAPILTAIFSLLTVRLFFTQTFSIKTYLVAALFFAAALFTYEQVVLLPVVLLCIALIEKEKVLKRKKLLFVFVLSIVTIAYIIARKLITSEVVGGYEGGNFLTMNWRTLAANSFRFFFRLWLNPAFSSSFILRVIIFLALLAYACFFFNKKSIINTKAVIFFSATIMLMIIPVLSLGVAINSFESGRYLYLPSIFLIAGISIGSIAVFYQNNRINIFLPALLICCSIYWLLGKYTASRHYRDASLYARTINDDVQLHFKSTSDTLFIDTLQLSVHRLPVFRLGFKTGIKWFNNGIDTGKIVVRHYFDEVTHSGLK